MSPEQAEGKSVDARSDIFSFGTILYEMLTGRRPFHEDTGIATLAAVVHKDPAALRELRPEIPAPIERIVERCLEKKPHQRWQNLGDVKHLLNDLPNRSNVETAMPAARSRWTWGALVAASILGVVATAAVFHSARRSPRAFGNAGDLTGLSIARDTMILALAEFTGSIWVEETQR